MKALLQHTMGGAGITAILALPLLALDVGNGAWIAAAFASATYYGREVSQRQEKHARMFHVKRYDIPFVGWFIWEWGGIAPALEWIAPTLASLAVGYIIS